MAGYIGTKAVLLSTTAATVTGNADIGGDLTVDSNTLYVDAANNRVGVGTASPSNPFQVGTSDLIVGSNGNVGIGGVPETTTSTYKALELGYSTAIFARTAANQSYFGNNVYQDSDWKYKTTDPAAVYQQVDDQHVFFNAASGAADTTVSFSEAMRIDSSGNLLVGSITYDKDVAGVYAGNNGVFYATTSSNFAASLNRKTSDGEIARFQKDGTTVGSIGSIGGSYLYIGDAGGVGLGLISTAVRPVTDGANADNVYDLGLSTVRWDDIYATNGTIQTSDRNEKQDIEVLSDAETRVAQACKGLLRKFRWQDAVAEKGDDARIHFGIIAQDLQDAFAAEGLDAGHYAMFISSTWWEHDGQTYETAEEAPEGAVERTRLGVRYPELLAFIIGAM